MNGQIKRRVKEECFYDLKQICIFNISILVNDLHVFIGRLAKNIAIVSKELPKALFISAHSTLPVFELRSSINKGKAFLIQDKMNFSTNVYSIEPKYAQVQEVFIQTFHEAHDAWIQWLIQEFTRKLKTSLVSTKWNDQCPSITVWESK